MMADDQCPVCLHCPAMAALWIILASFYRMMQLPGFHRPTSSAIEQHTGKLNSPADPPVVQFLLPPLPTPLNAKTVQMRKMRRKRHVIGLCWPPVVNLQWNKNKA
jgi:hypothetical protein